MTRMMWPGGQVEAESLDLDDMEERLDRGQLLSMQEQRDLVSALRLEMERTKYAYAEINGTPQSGTAAEEK